MKIKFMGLIPIEEPKGDWYEAWLSMTMTGVDSVTWKDRVRAAACLVLGHRDVVEIPFSEIVEPWRWKPEYENMLERFCKNCDSGYLKPKEKKVG